MAKNLKQKSVKREPLITDFGAYLRKLRLTASMTAADVAKVLSLSPSTIMNIEKGYNYPPNPARLSQWLQAVGFPQKLGEALRLLRRIKKKRLVTYFIRHPSTEDIDRILDAYENHTLDEMDMDLLKAIAIKEYTPPDYRPPASRRKTPEQRHPVKAKDVRVTEIKKLEHAKRARTRHK